MEAIDKLQQEIKGENRKEIIDSLEETIAEDIIKATKEKQFFSLPLNNILNNVSKTNLSEQEDPISLIKTIITKTIKSRPKRRETLLLLSSIKTNDIELTVDQCVDILSLFKQCNIFIQLHKRFHENDKEVDVDIDYLIKQKEKEIKELKHKLRKKSKPLFEPIPKISKIPEDFESDIFIATQEGKITSVQYLIEKEGIDINAQAEKIYFVMIYKGSTPLHIACQYSHLPIVRYLIEIGANIEAKDKYDKTPLHYACTTRHAPIIQYLVEKGANVLAEDKNKETPLQYVSKLGDIHLTILMTSKLLFSKY